MSEGLAQRKLRRTRQAIAGAAMDLFAERGFDQVTVAEVAAAAEVSEKTVFNHFTTKADLVFDADQGLAEGLVTAVRTRGAGESAIEAVRRFLAELAESLGQEAPTARQAAFRRVVSGSPALHTHQRVMAARYEDALAAVLEEETGAPPGSAEPFVVAVALVGALRAGLDAAPASGGPAAAMARACDALEAGLGGYAVRAPGTEEGSS
jgi:AcrR family transcriptional regulator